MRMKSVKRSHDYGKEGRLIIDVAIERLTKIGRKNDDGVNCRQMSRVIIQMRTIDLDPECR